jgi:hypothetical protein
MLPLEQSTLLLTNSIFSKPRPGMLEYVPDLEEAMRGLRQRGHWKIQDPSLGKPHVTGLTCKLHLEGRLMMINVGGCAGVQALIPLASLKEFIKGQQTVNTQLVRLVVADKSWNP